jgi:hypothetical protein
MVEMKSACDEASEVALWAWTGGTKLFYEAHATDAAQDLQWSQVPLRHTMVGGSDNAEFPADAAGVIIGFVRAQDTRIPVASVQKLCSYDQADGTGAPVAGAAYTEIGTVTLLGPELAEFSCVLGLACKVVVTGTGMPTSAKVGLVSGACSASPTFVSFGSGFSNPTAYDSTDADGENVATVPDDGTLTAAAFVFGTATAGSGGSLKLCWSADGSSGNWALPIDETANMYGPYSQTVVSCTLGEDCSIAPGGHGLGTIPAALGAAAKGTFAIIKGNCGSGTFLIASSNAWMHEETDDDLYRTVYVQQVHGTAADPILIPKVYGGRGGQNMGKLCWTGLAVDTAEGGDWDDPTKYNVQVSANFALAGPDAASFVNNNRCYLGENCLVTLAGYDYDLTTVEYTSDYDDG